MAAGYTKPQARTLFTGNFRQANPGSPAVFGPRKTATRPATIRGPVIAPGANPPPGATTQPMSPSLATPDQRDMVFTTNPVFEQVGLNRTQADAIVGNPALSRDFYEWYYNNPQGFLNQAAMGTWNPINTPYRFLYPGTGNGDVASAFTPQPPAMGDDLATLLGEYNDNLTAALSAMGGGYYGAPPMDQGGGGGGGLDQDSLALLLSLLQGQQGGDGQYPSPGYIYGG